LLDYFGMLLLLEPQQELHLLHLNMNPLSDSNLLLTSKIVWCYRQSKNNVECITVDFTKLWPPQLRGWLGIWEL
jgi:hypothetical protein